MKVVQIFSVMAFAVIPTLSFAAEGGHSGGGGTGIAASITRATNDFISIVEDNPAVFPELDVRKLKAANPQILPTAQKINSCDGLATLEAVSDSAANKSVFNIEAWKQKTDVIEKIFLAGHERLVLLGYERSNQYPISNRVFALGLAGAKLERASSNSCAWISDICADLEKLEDSVESTNVRFKSREISVDEALISMKGQKLFADQILLRAQFLTARKFKLFKKGRESQLKQSDLKVAIEIRSRTAPLFAASRELYMSGVRDSNLSCVQLR